MLAWSEKTSEIARQRRRKEQTEAEDLATRCSAATLIQAVWRSHNTRKVCRLLTHEVQHVRNTDAVR